MSKIYVWNIVCILTNCKQNSVTFRDYIWHIYRIYDYNVPVKIITDMNL
jgi:hypothetical protein